MLSTLKSTDHKTNARRRLLGLNYATFLLLCTTTITTALYEDDNCTTGDNSPGICKVDKQCTAIREALELGSIRAQDPVHCGFSGLDELICCPIDGSTTTTTTTTTTPTTTTTTRTSLRVTTTRRTRGGATATTVRNRIGERPAVTACRSIEELLLPDLTPHILGGTFAELGEYPHMAALGFPTIGTDVGPYEFRCGGTLIHKLFVLTAAHCVSGRNGPTVVRLGAVNFTDPKQLDNALEIGIKRVHIHPDYSNLYKVNDVALLELRSPVEYGANIMPVCLHNTLADPSSNSKLYVTGWGVVNETTGEMSQALMKARLEIVPLQRCNVTYDRQGRQLREQHLCAHDPGFTMDACQGDSGGPLNLVVDESIRLYSILGIITAGFDCASATPGLYMRVAAYLDYIENIVWPANRRDRTPI